MADSKAREFAEDVLERAAEEMPLDLRLAQKELRKLRDENARLRSGQAAIVSTVSRIFSDDDFDIAPPKRPAKDRRRNGEEHALLHLSDLQLGKQTPTYDMSKAAERLALAADLTIRFIEEKRETRPVKRLAIVFGGDMVEGENIFPSQPHEIDVPLLEQAVRLGPQILSKLVYTLLEHVEKIDVYSVPGNHGATGRYASTRTNWDTVLGELVQAMTLGAPGYERPEIKDRLTFTITDDFYTTIPFWDWNVLAVHGHQIKGGFGGFPFYGVGKKMQGWIKAIPEPWDYLIFGHWHTYAELTINGDLWFCNGSTESDNEFARENIASQNDPVQRLMFFAPSVGYVNSYPLYLKDAPRVPMSKRFA